MAHDLNLADCPDFGVHYRDKKQRQKLLSLILSNDRFLLFPWVTVPNLASHALALATTHIADDWGCRHGYRPVLLETFVDPTRDNPWFNQSIRCEGLAPIARSATGRNNPHHECRETKKAIYVYPLRRDQQEALPQ